MTTPIQYFRSAIAEKRIIQGSWNKTVDGKEYVCLAAAWGKPGTIHVVGDCPLDLFPRWVFELMPTLDDGVAASEVPWLFQNFSDRAEKMAAFIPGQWESVRSSFLIGVIDVAVDAASLVQPTPAPTYWKKVTDACEMVKHALRTGKGLAAAADDAADARADARAAARAAAADAAYAAADAADAAADAADAAARAAARADADAAYAAAYAAARADADAAAAAAYAAAYKQIASVFFACVDAQETA